MINDMYSLCIDIGTLWTLGQYVPNLNLFQFVLGCSSEFFFKNTMMLTTLSPNLMIFYHFPPSKSRKLSFTKYCLTKIVNVNAREIKYK